MKPAQIWKTLPDFPDYRISSHGTIISTMKKLPRTLKPFRMGKYIGIRLSHKDGTRVPFYIHCLVLITFYGPRPEGYECRHLDGDKSNNSHTNLTWGTHQENVDDRTKHGKVKKGEEHPFAKLTWDKVNKMRKIYPSIGGSYHNIGSKFGVSAATARNVLIGKTWKN